MVPFSNANQEKQLSVNEGQGASFANAMRAISIMAAMVFISACSTGSVNLSANGKRWGAPINAHASIGHNRRHNQHGTVPTIANSGAHQKIGRPYQVNGRTYVPARQDDYDRTGIASWYGPNFHGKKTANGEIYDMNGLSAAHTTLPLPSLVRVTNLGNGRSIIVRVNDRGPFVGNRLIDMSKSAAQELGFIRQGTARVRVQYVGPAVKNPGMANVHRASARSRNTTNWPAPKVRKNKKVTPYSFEQGWPKDSKDKYQIALSRPRIAVGGWFVQLGAFGERERAEQVASRLRTSGKASVQTAWVNNHYIHRVLVGPYDDRQSAEQQRYEVADAGFPEARVTEQR